MRRLRLSLLIVVVCELVGCNLELIVLRTGPEKLYNFFPLQSRFVEFNVVAESEVHVVFTQSPQFEQPYYEVVLRGEDVDNIKTETKSVIRANGNDVAQYENPAITKPGQHAFWISLNDTDNSVNVGQRRRKPFMKYTDPNFFGVGYIGFSTGSGKSGEFHFDTRIMKCSQLLPPNTYYSVFLSSDRIN